MAMIKLKWFCRPYYILGDMASHTRGVVWGDRRHERVRLRV